MGARMVLVCLIFWGFVLSVGAFYCLLGLCIVGRGFVKSFGTSPHPGPSAGVPSPPLSPHGAPRQAAPPTARPLRQGAKWNLAAAGPLFGRKPGFKICSKWVVNWQVPGLSCTSSYQMGAGIPEKTDLLQAAGTADRLSGIANGE